MPDGAASPLGLQPAGLATCVFMRGSTPMPDGAASPLGLQPAGLATCVFMRGSTPNRAG
jgi:hypothetical protein